MASLVKIIGFAVAIIVLGLLVSADGDGGGMSHFSEPLTLVMVFGLMAVLTLLTYEPGRLIEEFKKLFSKGPHQMDKRMMSQLALYALIAGIVSAIVQMLVRLNSPVESATPAAVLEIQKPPLMALLYGSLTAVALWVVAGLESPAKAENKGEIAPADKKQTIVAFCVLLVAAGTISVMIVGVHLTANGYLQELLDARKTTQLQPGSDDLEVVLENAPLAGFEVAESVVDIDIVPIMPNDKAEAAVYLVSSPTSSGISAGDDIPLRWESDVSTKIVKQNRLQRHKKAIDWPLGSAVEQIR